MVEVVLFFIYRQWLLLMQELLGLVIRRPAHIVVFSDIRSLARQLEPLAVSLADRAHYSVRKDLLVGACRLQDRVELLARGRMGKVETVRELSLSIISLFGRSSCDGARDQHASTLVVLPLKHHLVLIWKLN